MTMCRVLNVARAGFYAWLHNPISARDKDNQRLLALIRDSYSLSGGVYGYRRVHGDLNEIGETCGKNRVGRIMQLNRIKAVRGYKAPRRISGRPSVIAPNRVQRQFTVVRANQVWVTDITYIRTWQGWLYLAVVIDLFARNVVGWSMKPTLLRELALDALMMAVWRRKPDGKVIVHSDQGCQYGSDDWQRFCRANNLAPSMSRRGNCFVSRAVRCAPGSSGRGVYVCPGRFRAGRMSKAKKSHWSCVSWKNDRQFWRLFR